MKIFLLYIALCFSTASYSQKIKVVKDKDSNVVEIVRDTVIIVKEDTLTDRYSKNRKKADEEIHEEWFQKAIPIPNKFGATVAYKGTPWQRRHVKKKK